MRSQSAECVKWEILTKSRLTADRVARTIVASEFIPHKISVMEPNSVSVTRSHLLSTKVSANAICTCASFVSFFLKKCVSLVSKRCWDLGVPSPRLWPRTRFPVSKRGWAFQAPFVRKAVSARGGRRRSPRLDSEPRDKKESVSIVCAVSRRNVLNGKYLPNQDSPRTAWHGRSWLQSLFHIKFR